MRFPSRAIARSESRPRVRRVVYAYLTAATVTRAETESPLRPGASPWPRSAITKP